MKNLQKYQILLSDILSQTTLIEQTNLCIIAHMEESIKFWNTPTPRVNFSELCHPYQSMVTYETVDGHHQHCVQLSMTEQSELVIRYACVEVNCN